jgi:hypothetical protein
MEGTQRPESEEEESPSAEERDGSYPFWGILSFAEFGTRACGDDSRSLPVSATTAGRGIQGWLACLWLVPFFLLLWGSGTDPKLGSQSQPRNRQE